MLNTADDAVDLERDGRLHLSLRKALCEAQQHHHNTFSERECGEFANRVIELLDKAQAPRLGDSPAGDLHASAGGIEFVAHAANLWAKHGTYEVVKSTRNADGAAVSAGAAFTVTVTPPTGQVRVECPIETWGLFQVPEVERAPQHDGHGPEVARQRLLDAIVNASTARQSSRRSWRRR